MLVQRVQIVSVPSSDQDRSMAFYKDALGFEVINDAPMGPTMRWLQMAVPGTTFSITFTTWFDNAPGSLQGFMLNVDDVEAFAAHLHSLGFLESTEVSQQPWGRYVTVRDPDGNGIIIQQDPDR